MSVKTSAHKYSEQTWCAPKVAL